MKQILKFLLVLPLVAILCSCVGQHDEQTKPAYFVKLTSEKNQVDIDKSEKMVFSVTADGKDVTSKSYIVNVTDGAYTILKNTDGTFAYTYEPRRPSSHNFIAVYEDCSSETASVRAITSSSQSDKFYRRNAVYKYTGTWCKFCPEMGEIIKRVAKKRTDRLVEVSIHNNDQLAIPIGDELSRYAKAANLPEVMVDYRSATKITARIETAITGEMDKSNSENPTVAGIKMSVKQVGTKLEIETETKVARDGNYNLVVGILVDGYAYEQTGASDASYRQNSVLRDYLCSDIMGDQLGDPLTKYVLIKGETVKKNYSYNLTAGIEISRYRVFAMVLNKNSEGNFRTNNIIQCNVGQSTDYEYETIEK